MSNRSEGTGKFEIMCLQENIKSGLSVAERISGNNSALPILNNVLFEVDKSVLKISATDLEMGVEVSVPCKVENKGSVVVPAKLLLNFINNLPNTKIQFKDINGKLNVITDNVKTSIPAVDVDDFPIIPKIKDSVDISINAKVLKRSLEQVINSSAVSDAKPEIAGVLFDIKKEFINIVTTDTFRLSEKTIKNNSTYDIEESKSFILPQRTTQEMIKILDIDEDVIIRMGEGQVSFLFNKINLISRIIDGDYPNYKQIIPNDHKTKIVLDKLEFESKLKMASIFSSNINDINISINVSKKEFMVSSQDKVKGEFTSDVEFDELSGEDVSVSFNFRYLLDGINNISSNKIIFELNGQSAPAVLKPKDAKDYIYIAMPIKA